MASVTINGGFVNGDVVTVDATVDGTHHQLKFNRKDLEAMSQSQRQTFVALQFKTLNAAPTPMAVPAKGLEMAGTLTV